MGRRIEFRLLGPLEVRIDDAPVTVGGPKQRALLAVLLLSANRVVSRDQLIDEVFAGENGTGARRLNVQVSRLRKVLGESRLVTQPPGYLLQVAPGELDLHLFERSLADGRRALERGDFELASDQLTEALALWRGRPLADLEFEPFVRVEAERLEELRLSAVEDRIEAELALGRHGALVPELELLVAAHPLRERLRGQLMLALYRSGRQAEALEVYRAGRALLVDELALEPSPRLKELEQAILRQDSALDCQEHERAASHATGVTVAVAEGTPPIVLSSVTEAPARAPRRRRRWALIGVTAMAALGSGLALTIAVTGGGHASTKTTLNAKQSASGKAPPAVVPNSLVQIDPRTDRIVSVTRVGSSPTSLALADNAVWVVNRGDRTVSRVDVRTRAIRTLGGIPFAYDVAADGHGSIWISGSAAPVVTQLMSGVEHFPQEPSAPKSVRVSGDSGYLAVGGGYLWVTNGINTGSPTGNTVSRIDLRTDKVVSKLAVGQRPLWIAFGYGSAWVSNYDSETISVIRPGSNHPDTIHLQMIRDQTPLGIAIGAGSVWVVTVNDEVVRIDPQTERIIGRVQLGGSGGDLQPFSISVGGGYVWVTNRDDFSVAKIDPRKNRVVARIPVGSLGAFPCDIAATRAAVWVTIGNDSECATPHE